MKYLWFLILLVEVLPVIAASECEREWSNLPEINFQDGNSLELLKAWKSKENKCKKSAFYQWKLGLLLVQVGSFNDATKIFENGLKLGGYEFELKLAIVDLKFQISTRRDSELNSTVLNESIKDLDALITEYPENPEVYEQMTSMMLVMEDFDKVAEYASKSISLGGGGLTYRNLAIALYQAGKDTEAINAAVQAINKLDFLKGDRDLILVVALAYSNLGVFDKSLGALQLLSQYNPSVKTNLEFQRAVNFIQEKYKKQQ